MADEVKKFKYGDQEIDTNKLAKYLHDNADGWLASQNYGKDSEGVRNSINDLIGRIQSGDVYSLDYSGNLHSNTDFTNNSRDKHFLGIKTGSTADTNGAAAYYLDQALKGMGTSASSANTSKTKFSNDLLHKAFLNKINAGNELDDNTIQDLWYNLDEKGKDGLRKRDNRLKQYGQFLREYSGSEDLNNYDYEGSAFKDSDTYKQALLKAAELAEAGDYDNFIKAYAAAGGNDYATLFHQGDTQTPEKTKQQEAEDALKTKWKGEGYTDAQINEMLEAERAKMNSARNTEYLQTLEDKDWQNYANQTFNSVANGTWDLNKYNGGKARGDAFWIGNLGNASGKGGGKGEYDKESYFAKNHQVATNVMNKLKRGEALSSTIKYADGVSEDELGAVALYYRMQTNPEEFIETKDGYIYKPSIQANGTAYRYNPKTRKLYLYHNKGKETEALNNYYKEKWKKERYNTNTGKFKKGGILRAQDGAYFKQLAKTKRDKDMAKLKEEADAKGMTVDQYRASNRHISMDNSDNWDLSQFDSSDYARMVGMGADIAGLIASFTGAGTVANAGTGLVSLGSNLYADIADKSVSTGDVLKNAGTNLGLGLAGFIPGMNSVKILKAVKTLGPKVWAMCNAYGVVMNPEVQKSWAKALHSGDANRMTVQDWKNIGSTFTALRGATQAGATALKGRKFAKMAGKTKVTKEFTPKKTQLGENAGKLSKMKAGISDKASNALGNLKNSVKNRLSSDYTYDMNKVAAMKRLNNRTTGSTLMDMIKGRGKYSDMNLWMQNQNFKGTPIVTTPTQVNPDQFNSTKMNPIEAKQRWNHKIYLKSDDPARRNLAIKSLSYAPQYRVATYTPAANLPTWKQGGILKFQTGGITPNWFTGRYKQQFLTGWDKALDASKAGDNLNTNPLHHQYGDLTGAYDSNQAYTSNSNLVGQDLNTFYNSNFKGQDLNSFVNGYNSNANTIRSRWQRDNINYNDQDAQSHNRLFRSMFASRSGNTSNAYDLGYSPDTENTQGSTTWMRRMDQYENPFENLSDEEKKSRIHKIGDLGFVYKKENGDIAVVDDATLTRLGLKQNPVQGTPQGGLSDAITHVNGTQKAPNKNGAKLLQALKGIDPGLAQIPLGLAANERMKNLMLDKRVSLDSYTPINRNIKGDYSTLQGAYSQADNVGATAGRLAGNVANSNLAIASTLEGANKAGAMRSQANQAYNTSVNQSAKQAWTQNKENQAALDEVRNENSMRLVQDFNSKQDVKAGADPYNNIWKPFIMEQSYNWKTKQADLKNNNLKLQQLLAQRHKEDFLYPYKQRYNTAVASGKQADIDRAITEYTNAVENYKRNQGRIDENNIYRAMGINIEDKNTPRSFSFPALKQGGVLQYLKSGNKVKDDGPVKTRTKDADRFQKAIQHAANSHDKKLARLANSYMASFKRTMGK